MRGDDRFDELPPEEKEPPIFMLELYAGEGGATREREEQLGLMRILSNSDSGKRRFHRLYFPRYRKRKKYRGKKHIAEIIHTVAEGKNPNHNCSN